MTGDENDEGGERVILMLYVNLDEHSVYLDCHRARYAALAQARDRAAVTNARPTYAVADRERVERLPTPGCRRQVCVRQPRSLDAHGRPICA